MPLTLQEKTRFFFVLDEDALKKWITESFHPADLWTVDYLIMNILGEATTEQLHFIQDAINGKI